jgi:hypothetical protein
MDITTGAVQSYQKNQNLSSWIDQTEGSGAIESALPEEKDLASDSIHISNQRKIYEWMAQEFPQQLNTTANVNRVNHTFYEYQILSLEELNQVNSLINESQEFNIMEEVETAFSNSTSFSEKQQLQHIRQVYSTLQAAQGNQAA